MGSGGRTECVARTARRHRSRCEEVRLYQLRQFCVVFFGDMSFCRHRFFLRSSRCTNINVLRCALEKQHLLENRRARENGRRLTCCWADGVATEAGGAQARPVSPWMIDDPAVFCFRGFLKVIVELCEETASGERGVGPLCDHNDKRWEAASHILRGTTAAKPRTGRLRSSRRWLVNVCCSLQCSCFCSGRFRARGHGRWRFERD